jgi:transposase
MAMNTGRQRRAFTQEYKDEVVTLYRTTEKSAGAIAKELDLTPSAVRRWVAEAEAEAGNEQGGLSKDERAELLQLRKENRILREERDILKRATAFFAKETR